MARQCKSHHSVLTKYSHEIQRRYPLSFAQKGLPCLFFFYRDGRYLLIMTENFAALPRIKQLLLEQDEEEPYVIFGSGFPKDQLFTQVKFCAKCHFYSLSLCICLLSVPLPVSPHHCLYISVPDVCLSLSACLSAYLFKCVSFCLFNVSVALAISFSVAFTH